MKAATDTGDQVCSSFLDTGWLSTMEIGSGSEDQPVSGFWKNPKR